MDGIADEIDLVLIFFNKQGVLGLWKWITSKYSHVLSSVIEHWPLTEEGNDESSTFPDVYTSPNPNGREYDNLYLDLNGMIHSAFTSEKVCSLHRFMNEITNPGII